LGKVYLEELRKKSIQDLNKGYSEILRVIEGEKDAINEMYSNKLTRYLGGTNKKLCESHFIA